MRFIILPIGLLVMALLMLVLVAGSSQWVVAKAPQEAQGTTIQNDVGAPFDLRDPERIESGKALFDSTCASFCHGSEPSLFIGRTDLEPDYVYTVIRDGGRGATPMPPWGDILTPEEIWELVAYVRSLGDYPE